MQQALREIIVNTNVSKYNITHNAAHNAAHEVTDKSAETLSALIQIAPVEAATSVYKISKQRILIIGQVEDDESIKRGCGDVNSNSLLCQHARKARPDAWLVYKPHPDVVSGNRKGAVAKAVLDSCVNEVSHNPSIITEIVRCHELHTMTSLSGFEALLRHKPVFTYGMPFYAGWGLTQDSMTCDRRTRSRSLDELVYLALIAYPRYLHVESGEFMTAEQLIEINSRNVRSNSTSDNKIMNYRWLRKLRNIKAAIRYAA